MLFEKKSLPDNPQKLLFLDIDGVLNSRPFFEHSLQYKLDTLFRRKDQVRQFSLKKIKLLKSIHDATNCTIVMSSSWRCFYFEEAVARNSILELKKALKKYNMEILYKTSNNYDAEEYGKQNGVAFIKNADGTYDSQRMTVEKKTTIDKFYERGYQIYEFLKSWEDKFGKVSFAVLDDDCGDLKLFNADGYTRFINTKWYGKNEKETGLTKESVKLAVAVLNNIEPPDHSWMQKLF